MVGPVFNQYINGVRMKLMHKFLAVGAVVASLTSNCVASGFAGTQFYGELTLAYSPYVQSSQTYWNNSATVGDGLEFVYEDVANRLTADFTDTQLIIENHIFPQYNIPVFFMNFTGPLGFFSLVSSNFPDYIPSTGFGGIRYFSSTSATDDALTSYNFAFFGDSTGGHDYRAVFNLTSVPEPATYLLMIMGLLALGASTNRRKPMV